MKERTCDATQYPKDYHQRVDSEKKKSIKNLTKDLTIGKVKK